MYSISNDELAKAEPLGEYVDCTCGRRHKVMTSTGDKKTDPTQIHYYMCRGTAFMAGLNGKDVMHTFSKPGDGRKPKRKK